MTESNTNDAPEKTGEKPVIKGYFYVNDAPVRIALWPAKSGNGYTGSIETTDGNKTYISAFRDSEKKDGSPASPKAPLKVYPGGSNDWAHPMMELFPKTEKRSGDAIDKPFLSGKYEGSEVAVNIEFGHDLVGLPVPAPSSDAGEEAAPAQATGTAPAV